MEIARTKHVLHALLNAHISPLTREALVKAFNDDGILNLEDMVAHILKRIERDAEIVKTEPRLIDFDLLRKRTSKERAATISHIAPEIPFVLDGVIYESKDIRRFDGKALVFIPLFAADGSPRLQVFHDEIRDVVAGYFQTRQLAFLLNPNDFPIPSLPPSTPPGTPPGTQPPGYPPLVGCGSPGLPPCGQSGQPPTPPGRHRRLVSRTRQ